MGQTLAPLEVDRATISIIVDNNIDLLMESSDIAKRFPMDPKPFEKLFPLGEHGFSAVIKVEREDKEAQILFDAGISHKGILHNLDALEFDLKDVQAIMLSHGHADHSMGLTGVVDRLGTHNMPMLLHPDAFLERKLILPTGDEIEIPPPNVADFRRENIEVIEEVGPSMLVDGMILVSGEVARTTEFEKGFPVHYCKRGDCWEKDPMIMDDQFALINVKDKGLIIITGCGHSGIINIIRHAQKVTGIEKVYAVIGGFHLTGGVFDPIIPATVAALKEIDPTYVMPGHCTGWTALHEIAMAMPDAYIPNSVGTTLEL